MKSIAELNKLEDWEQLDVIHCPDYSCKGMLLCHQLSVPGKCSDCGKYWYSRTEWFEVKE